MCEREGVCVCVRARAILRASVRPCVCVCVCVVRYCGVRHCILRYGLAEAEEDGNETLSHLSRRLERCSNQIQSNPI